MTGILGGLPPGLRGYVAAENQNQRQTMGQLGMLQGILGMQGALAQQQQAAQMAPLQLEAARMKIDAMRNPGPKWEVKEIFDKDGRKQKVAINLLDPSSPPIPIGGSEAVRMEVSPAGEAYNPYGLKPGQRIDVTTPHQTWQQNTQFPTQVGIDLARLNQPVLSEAAGGWVPRPQVSLPGFGGVPMAPRAPQGQMPSAMDATPRISPNMMVSPQDQARRDQEAARIRTAEVQPNGGGMLPTSAVIPVPGLEKKPEKPTAESLKQTTGVANLRTAISTYKDALAGFGALDILNPAARARIGTAYNNMLLQAKEAYNLGVLNGPDYMILQEVITNPTSMTGAITPKTALNDQLAQLDRIMSGVGETVQAVQADRGRGTYNAPKAPTVGAVVDGYRFKGGDPAKRESWVKQ
jgi:hypothetical protein